MKTVIRAVAMGILGVAAVAGSAHGDALTKINGCDVTNEPTMRRGLTDAMQHARYMVMEADQAAGRVVLRAASGFVYDLSCNGGTRVLMRGERPAYVGALLPGDIVAIPVPGEISLLRRPWDEAGSPER